jgi:hypothetical protein
MHRFFIAWRWEIVRLSSWFRLAIALICLVGQSTFGQIDSSAVSSTQFLSNLNAKQFANPAAGHTFPIAPFPNMEKRQELVQETVQATYALAAAPADRTAVGGVATAEFESAQPASGVAVGSGVSVSPSTAPPTALPPGSGDASSLPAPTKHKGFWPGHDWLNLDPRNPDFLIEAEILSLRRSNDSGGDISNNGDFGRFGREQAGRFTVAKLEGIVDRTEFTWTGPMEWNRAATTLGPVGTNLNHGLQPASSLGVFHDADLHRQSHRVELSSFELNRRWSGDGLSSFLCGLRFVNHEEQYQLDATQGASMGSFQMSTNNLLVGGQMGLSLVRPLSQRLHLGIASSVGAFGNFASGRFTLTDGAINASGSDGAARVVWMFQPNARLHYRMSQNSILHGGYESWYFSGLSTTADQRLGDVLSPSALGVRTRDDQLFHGWTAGISIRF